MLDVQMIVNSHKLQEVINDVDCIDKRKGCVFVVLSFLYYIL